MPLKLDRITVQAKDIVGLYLAAFKVGTLLIELGSHASPDWPYTLMHDSMLPVNASELSNSPILPLQHVRNRRLHLRFVPSRRLHVDRDLFLNLGRVQNLSVEVDHNPEEDGGFDPLNLGRIVDTLELLLLFSCKRYLCITIPIIFAYNLLLFDCVIWQTYYCM